MKTFDPQDLAETKESITLSAEDFLKRCQEHAQWVERCMPPRQEAEWIPQLQIWTKSGFEEKEELSVEALHVDFNTDEEKYAVMKARGRALGQIQKVQCPTCLIMSSEAWQTDDPRYMGGPEGSQPKDDPQRREVIVVQGLAVATQQFLHSAAPLERRNGRLCSKLQFEPFEAPGGPLRLLIWFMAGYVQAVSEKLGARGN